MRGINSTTCGSKAIRDDWDTWNIPQIPTPPIFLVGDKYRFASNKIDKIASPTPPLFMQQFLPKILPSVMQTEGSELKC